MSKEYLLANHQEELHEILADPDETKTFSIIVDFISLFNDDIELTEKILHTPRRYLPQCNEAAIKAQEILKDQDTQENSFKYTVKPRVRIRIRGVPNKVDDTEIGELILITGTIVRISQPCVSLIEKHYQCSKCKHVTIVKLEWERGIFPDIKECSACKKKTLHGESSVIYRECIDIQEIKIQDKIRGDSDCNVTVAYHVILTEDLVDKCTSGDQVNISGYIINKSPPVVEQQRLLSIPVMFANYLHLNTKVVESTFSQTELDKVFREYWEKYKINPLVGRDNILASICPQLYGMYYIKLALAVILAGGVLKQNKNGIRVRGDSHLLLCGDPGTGKSQILRTAARLATRSVLTTGIGTTAAGLTAAAVKDSEGWHLEAGALVLSNGGVCCIDELTTMSSHDMASIHEAMEQQTISIAKACLLSTLNCRCTIVAAINPKGGRFVDGQEVKMRLGGPLLSRFDLILFLRDKHDAQWDELVSSHILNSAVKENVLANSKSMSDSTCCDITEDGFIYQDSKLNILNTDGLWSEKTLREYFTYIRTFKPKITSRAEKILREAFLYHRHQSDRQEERTTVRLMDSLVRLAEGHAKLMYRNSVEVMDVIYAIHLINLSNQIGKDRPRFPQSPGICYKEDGAELLHVLNLDNFIEFL